MALTYQQKQELDRLVKSLIVANDEREKLKVLWRSEKDAYAIYSGPEFDIDHKVSPGIWPPPPLENNGN
jgi:hypothetical protein|tara:strand:+ start:2912 stop:3118 length:207 start_codon:yes stop_codon:yes gene_type:complete